MKMRIIEKELFAAKPYFKMFSPSLWYLPIPIYGKWVKAGKSVIVAQRAYKMYKKGDPISHVVGDVIAGRMIRLAVRPVKRGVRRTHVHVIKSQRDPSRKNGIGGRSWITHPGQQDLVVVFHDANRVGPHLDVHIGRLSLVYRVKPDLYAQLKYNNQGMLTENSKKLLLDHIRSEIETKSRVPQNIDHSKTNARSTWVGGDRSATHYGAATTRQIILESKVDVYKAYADGPIEMYAPVLNAQRGLYLYQIYPGDAKSAPILIFGSRTNQPPKLDERLHLKLTDPVSAKEQLDGQVDWNTTTAKYDGSSAYIVITKDGTTVWSPRQSVRTGEQIEYTWKLDGLASARSHYQFDRGLYGTDAVPRLLEVDSGETIVAMGEVLFRDAKPWWDPRSNTNPYYSSARGSGILNSQTVLPKGVEPEIRLYRVDRIGRTSTRDLPFGDNRAYQYRVAGLHDRLAVVDLMTPEETLEKGFEGYVVIPNGGSVNDGFKIKYWQDANDWRIDQVAFEYSSGGNIAGVVHATSLDSGKQFKLGPGQIGNRELTERMLNDPETYQGAVLKVRSRQGHEGRAAKAVGFHDDKGFSPI